MGSHWRRVTLVGWTLFGLCGATAVVRAATSELPSPERRLSEAERLQVGHAAAAEEPGWRRASRKSFPGDHWSQDDDFGASERRWAVDEARRRGVPVTDVLGAIDEGGLEAQLQASFALERRYMERALAYLQDVIKAPTEDVEPAIAVHVEPFQRRMSTSLPEANTSVSDSAQNPV